MRCDDQSGELEMSLVDFLDYTHLLLRTVRSSISMLRNQLDSKKFSVLRTVTLGVA